MKNSFKKTSLKPIFMSLIIFFSIPAINSTIVCASLQKNCDENFESGFYEEHEETQNVDGNDGSTTTDETTLGKPKEEPESEKADDNKSKPLFSNIFDDLSESKTNKYLFLRNILLEKQNNK